MGEEYQRGRYDELVERHKELLELHRHLLWEMQTTQLSSGAGVHGGQVNVYAGSKIDSRAIAWSIGSASAVFSVLAYFVGLVPLALGVAITVFSLVFGLSLYLTKNKEEHEHQPLPQLPPIPPKRS